MHLATRRTLSTELIEEIYPSYVQAWDHLQPHVAARHVLSFEEFSEEMTDRRIAKVLVIDDHDEQVLGMTTVVTDISAVPWANAQFYLERYAEEIERGAFFYVGYTIVHRPVRGTRAVYLMRQEVDRVLHQAAGIIGFDMSRYVLDHGLGRRLDHLFPSSREIELLDRQTYFVADYRPQVDVGVPQASQRDFRVVRISERPELLEQLTELLTARWPAFMLAGHPGHDVIIQPLLQDLPDYQVGLVDSAGTLRGAGLGLPCRWSGAVDDLPHGWDDAVERCARSVADGDRPTCVISLSITIAPELSGRGLGSRVITGMMDAARDAGASDFIAPVRLIGKAAYPLADAQEYASWTTSAGEAFDPALRTYTDLDCEPLAVAEESMIISGSVNEWEQWLSMPLPGSGRFTIPGGLSVLEVDRDADEATYREPAVWVRRRL